MRFCAEPVLSSRDSRFVLLLEASHESPSTSCKATRDA
jgi:hypothetical protein